MRVEELVGRPHLEDHKTAVVAAELLNKLVATFEDRLQLELAVLKGGTAKDLQEHCNLDLVLDDALDLVFEDRWEVVSDKSAAAAVLERVRGRATQAALSFSYVLYGSRASA